MRKVAVVLAFVACTASGQSVYKCRDAKGTPVYQSEPCANAEKRWDTQPSATTWDDYYKRQAAERKIAADRRHMRVRAQEIAAGASPVGAAVGPQASSACQQAKSQRQAAYDAAGLNRSFELSRQMDDMVYNACK